MGVRRAGAELASSPKVSSCTINYIVRDFSGPPVNGALFAGVLAGGRQMPQTASARDDQRERGSPSPGSEPVGQRKSGTQRIHPNLGASTSSPRTYTGVFRWSKVRSRSSAWIRSRWRRIKRSSDTFKVAPIDGRGQLAVQVSDCLFAPAAGVNVVLKTADTHTMGFSSTTGNMTAVTDTSGLIFFVNVPAGLTPITATPAGLTAPAAQATVYVEPGIETVVYMWKMPSQ